MEQNTTQLNTEVNLPAFLDTNALLSIICETNAVQKTCHPAPEYTPEQLSDIHLLLTVMNSDERICDFCHEEGLSYRDPETQCIYCLRCLELSTEPLEEEGEEDAEIVAIGRCILDGLYLSQTSN